MDKTLPTGLDLDRTSDNSSCEITGIPATATAEATYRVTATNATGADTTPATVSITVVEPVDADGDGLIEISTLEELNNVRYSLDGAGYKTSADATPDTAGCPNDVCRGYELTANLTFDADNDGGTWTRNIDGSVTLDADDDNNDYFDIASDGSSGGWVPIGDCGSNGLCYDDSLTAEDETADDAPFTAVFEGNDHTITGLASVRDLGFIGLFGFISEGAEIHNLGLVGNLVRYAGTPSRRSAFVGGLVGMMEGSTITASYTIGDADGGVVGGLVGSQSEGSVITASHAIGNVEGGDDGGSSVGGLVGSQSRNSIITASYAAGDVDGGAGRDRVGGLVGFQAEGSVITASYATGDADGGAGNQDYVGGLVGLEATGSVITASYSAGRVEGGDGDSDRVGGLVGYQHNSVSIAASYATGNADGGGGVRDHVGALIGDLYLGPVTVKWGLGDITASWGFGTTTGHEFDGVDGSIDDDRDSDRPGGITSATSLISGNVPATWNEADSSTLGAWDFGTATQVPLLRYADYDGSGTSFHCASDAANAPDDAILIPNCGTLILAIAASNVLALTADINVISGTAGTAYVAVLADGAMAPTAAAIKAAVAGSGGVVAVGSAAVASGRATVSLTGLMESSMHDAYIVVDSGGVLGTVMKVNVNTKAAVSVENVLATTADIHVLSGTAGTAYIAVLADGAATPNATAIKAAVVGSGGVVAADKAGVAVGTRTTLGLTGLEGSASYDVYAVVELGDGTFGTVMKIDLTTPRFADADGNGLIEIGTLAELNNVRYNLTGTSYLAGPNATNATGGCPVDGCFGYELTADLDFDSDGDGSTWVRNSDGSVTLDVDDSHPDYFNTVEGGWVPIGNTSSVYIANSFNRRDDLGDFTAVFEGNGHTISGLATMRDLAYIGLFGTIGLGADIRNLGLVGNLAKYTLVLSYDTAIAGGLVGYQRGGSITASYSTGRVEGSDNDNEIVGGLVGWQQGGRITASYATGDADGGAGDGDLVGGLVGLQVVSSITASYATGDADGGAGDGDLVGGLVGRQGGSSTIGSSSITASYATGDADGGTGDGDLVGGLVGQQSEGTVTASWSFGSKTGGENDGIDGSADSSGNSDRPNGVSSAADLTSANVPASWNEAASNTLGAWNFGTSSQAPALNYADYDGSSTGFYCASATNPPGYAILISNCGTLIPGVVTAANVLVLTADINVISGAAGTAYVAVLADGAMVPTAVAIKAAVAGSGGVVAVGSVAVTAGTRATVSLAGLMESSMYDAYIVVESGGVLGTVMKVDVATSVLARPNLANAPAANLIARTEITTISFTNSGGGILTNCAVDKTLPTGLDLDRTSGNGSCEITGIPSVVSGPTIYTVIATNATGADSTPATVSITVAPARPNLANAPAASLVAGTEITTISFTNNGGGHCADQPRGGQDAAHWPRPGPHQRQQQLRDHWHPASRQQSDHLHNHRHQRHGRGHHASHRFHHCHGCTGAAQPCQCPCRQPHCRNGNHRHLVHQQWRWRPEPARRHPARLHSQPDIADRA